jgi:hypothetical protein
MRVAPAQSRGLDQLVALDLVLKLTDAVAWLRGADCMNWRKVYSITLDVVLFVLFAYIAATAVSG